MSFTSPFEAATTVAAAVAVASIPCCFTKCIEIRADKQKLKGDARKLKEEYYFDYVDNFVDATRDDKDADENTKKVIKEACAKLSHVHNRILLIGSSAVVKNMRELHDYCEALAKSKEEIGAKFKELLTELVKSMRIDLYKDKNINTDYPVVNFIGKNSKIILLKQIIEIFENQDFIDKKDVIEKLKNLEKGFSKVKIY